MNSIVAIAISATTRTPSVRWRRKGLKPEMMADAPRRSASIGCDRDWRIAGIRPNIIPVRIEMITVKASTDRSSETSSSRGMPMPPGRSRRGSDAASERSSRTPPSARPMPKAAAHDAEQHAFGERLTDHSAPSGAKCQTDGRFPVPRGAAGKKQAGDVHARNQQHQADCAGQHEQRRLHRRDQLDPSAERSRTG